MNASAQSGDAIVRTTPALSAACAAAAAEGVLALDTEFVWNSTYRPRLGLVQLGCRAGCWALDCFAGLNAESLANLVGDASTVKVLHDARQDLSLIRHYCGAEPRNVFDTQLAAAFAGFPSGMGLQTLLFEAIGVGLAKTETCTDWTRRPLSPAQVEYALDDVRYLPDLRDELLSRAEGFGNRSYLEEEMAGLDGCATSQESDPDSAWKRIKLRGIRLDPRGFAVLRAVASLRERRASELNLPRGWLGDDAYLVRMASDRRVGRVSHRLNGGQAEIMRAKYAEAVEEALALPDEECPENPRPRYISEVLSAAEEALAWLEARADAVHIAPSVIANRAELTAFVDNAEDETNPLASGWRFEVAGREIATRFAVD